MARPIDMKAGVVVTWFTGCASTVEAMETHGDAGRPILIIEAKCAFLSFDDMPQVSHGARIPWSA